MNPIHLLKEKSLASKRLKFPSFPPEYLSTYAYTDKTSNGLTRCIIDWITLHDYQAERISTTGRVINNRRAVKDAMGFTQVIGSSKYIPGSGTRGSADISATIKGRSVKIEVKIGRDKQSEHQLTYQRQIEKAGGVYIVVHDFAEFIQWWNLFEGGNELPF